MQADQTVLSFRPRGGRRGRRVLGPRFDSSAFSSSDLPVLRPHGGAPTSFSIKTGDSGFDGRERFRYTRDQLLQLRETGDSRFDGRERVCYTRDQLLQLREVAPVSSAEVPHNISMVITEIPPLGEVASSLASAGEATFSAKVVEATEQAVSVVPEESPNQSSSDEDSSCDTPGISVPPAQHLKGLLSEDLGTSEETRTLLNKLFEDRPETFTADCIRSNYDIMIIKLRTLAMIIQKIMDTPLSGLSRRILSKYRRDLNDMVKEGFNVQWLTSQLIRLKKLPTRSLQSRFHQNTSELTKLQNDLQVLSSKKVKAEEALASAQKLLGDIELEEAAMTQRVAEVTGLQEQVIADVTVRFGGLGDKFFSSPNLSFLL